MQVDGHEISQDVIRAVTARIRGTAEFTFNDVRGWLLQAGVPWEPSWRATDRLLQWERRHGHIRHHGGTWRSLTVAAQREAHLAPAP